MKGLRHASCFQFRLWVEVKIDFMFVVLGLANPAVRYSTCVFRVSKVCYCSNTDHGIHHGQGKVAYSSCFVNNALFCCFKYHEGKQRHTCPGKETTRCSSDRLDCYCKRSCCCLGRLYNNSDTTKVRTQCCLEISARYHTDARTH